MSVHGNNSRKRTVLLTNTFFNPRGCPLMRELTLINTEVVLTSWTGFWINLVNTVVSWWTGVTLCSLGVVHVWSWRTFKWDSCANRTIMSNPTNITWEERKTIIGNSDRCVNGNSVLREKKILPVVNCFRKQVENHKSTMGYHSKFSYLTTRIYLFISPHTKKKLHEKEERKQIHICARFKNKKKKKLKQRN